MNFNREPKSYVRRGAIVAGGAALVCSQLVSCSGDSKPSTPLPTGAVVVKGADGAAYLDECFTLSGKPGNVYTIQANETNGFYAGGAHFVVAPQLIQENGASGAGFGDTTDLSVPILVADLKDGVLTARTKPYTNPDTGQQVDCQEKWPGDPANVASLVGNLAVYTRADNPALTGPIDSSYYDGMDLGEYFAQN